VVRVRPERDKRPDGNTQERYLYSRKESREAIRNREAIRVGDDARDRKETGNRKEAGNREPRVVSPEVVRPDRAQYGRAEVRTMPARIESRKAEVPRVESRKAKKESGWSKLVKVVRTTIERESGRKTRSQAGAKDSKTSKVSDGKSRKKGSDPKIVRAQVSDKKSSGESGRSRKAASKARTDSKGKSQSTRRRVSD
jgi:hypothetical protein